MPDYIDPDWEYREDNYEVLWAMGATEKVELRGKDDGFAILPDPNYRYLRLAKDPEGYLWNADHRHKSKFLPKCIVCNKIFKADRSSQQICRLCPQPANRWNGVTPGKPCAKCGEITGHRKRKMCRRCSHLWRIENARALASARNTRIITKCAQCGKDFEASKNHKKFCCKECYTTWQVGRRVTLFPRRCSFCNTEFQPSRHFVIYCSTRCSADRRWRDERLKKMREYKPMTLETAIDAMKSGMKFGDVYQFLSNPERDGDSLRHYFVHGTLPVDSTLELPPSKGSNGVHINTLSPDKLKKGEETGDACNTCGGLLIRTGTCLTCQSCGNSSGGCG